MGWLVILFFVAGALVFLLDVVANGLGYERLGECLKGQYLMEIVSNKKQEFCLRRSIPFQYCSAAFENSDAEALAIYEYAHSITTGTYKEHPLGKRAADLSHFDFINNPFVKRRTGC